MTSEFLEYSRSRGNDLSTPRKSTQFSGLRDDDRWCLCAASMQAYIIHFIFTFTFFHTCISIVFPEWTGIFDVDESCDQTECCCISKRAIITRPENTRLLITANVAGAACRDIVNTSTSISSLIPIPQEKNGFQIITKFLSSDCRFTLSYDSKFIVDINLQYPKCSGTGIRVENEVNTTPSIFSSSILIFLSVVFSLCMN
ncbi:unnamed protein product [Rotaria socialis]|uniref:Uncharacterized protein n=1 Tax=Rotaria socialis TaxID=392032 RepID=A0A820ZYY4_9BILA|nr:unnamed protein product [Rotaria socialis]CAF4569357.1 unnamed protein product [Rotaria socialis]